MAAIELPGLTSKAPASPLAQLLGQGGETAQDGAIPGDFAAMLAASQTAAANPASLLPAMPATASGKPTGKAGGKSLPDDLPLADIALPASFPEGESEDPASQPEPALPLLDPPMLAQSVLAQPVLAPPVPAQPPVAVPPQRASQAIAGEAAPAAEASRRGPPQQTAPAALPQTIAAQVARIVAGQDSARPATRPQPAGVQVTAVGVAFELPAAATAQPAAQTPAAVAPAQPATIPVAALLPRGEAQQPALPEAAISARRAAAASADLPTAPATVELPAEGMALRTDMAASPAIAPAQALPAAGAPAAPAPAAPHDFAALVDRLIEARDAAMASQSPQVVHSTLRHADFGQVSIRFETAGDGLSASLSSPDPDFARAVQASAATGQGSLNAEQQGGQSRQDGQNAFAQSQQRSNGQQPQGQQPQAADSRWRDAPVAGRRGDDSDNSAAPQGRGIYA